MVFDHVIRVEDDPRGAFRKYWEQEPAKAA